MNNALRKKKKNFDALKFKEECQLELRERLSDMPSEMTYAEKVNKIAAQGELGHWWRGRGYTPAID